MWPGFTQVSRKKNIVVGHSWGGAVLTKFVSNAAYQGKYNGWIVADGIINGFELANAILSYSLGRCNELIAEGNGYATMRNLNTWIRQLHERREYP